MFISSFVSADISAKILMLEKAAVLGNPVVKVTTEYTLPDGTKKNGFVYYPLARFTKENVISDVKEHVNTILKYYITENKAAISSAVDQKINDVLAQQAAATGAQQIIGTTYTITGSTDAESGAYLRATGTIEGAYK